MKRTVIKAFIFNSDNEKIDKEVFTNSDYKILHEKKGQHNNYNAIISKKLKEFLEKNG
jgi:hypothetical protein